MKAYTIHKTRSSHPFPCRSGRIACLLVVAMFALSMDIGCQPTPSEDVVPQKDTVAMLEMAKRTESINVPVGNAEETPPVSLRERYGIPDTYQYEAELAEGHFILHVDAAVEIPETNTIPIVRIERAQFSPETIKTIFRSLCGDTEMFYMQESGVYTKSQIADRVQYLMNEISNEAAYISEHGETSLAEVQAEIQKLQASYADAPDDLEDIPCFGDLKLYRRGEKEALGIQALSKDINRRTSFFANNPENDGSPDSLSDDTYISFLNGSPLPERVECFPVSDDTAAEAYLPEQAKADVIAFLDQAGIHDFEIDSVLAPQDQAKETSEPIYLVQCVRVVSSVKTAPLASMAFSVDREAYAPIWTYEYIEIWVDPNGIVRMEWFAPIQVKETVVEDAHLLPFEKVMEIYQNMVDIKYASAMNITNPDRLYGATLQNEYNIDRITLTLQRIQEPNVWDSALLVPVWNFYGTNTRTEVEDYIEDTETRYLFDSMISINAINGSIINIYKGY